MASLISETLYFIDFRDVIWTTADTHQTGGAAAGINVRHHSTDGLFGIRQEAAGPGRCGHGLGDALADQLRGVGQTAQEDTLRGEVHRPQLGMRFDKVAEGISRQFQQGGKFFFIVGPDAGAEDEGIGIDLYRHLQDMINEGNADFIALFGYLRRSLRIKTGKDDSQIPGLAVVVFQDAVGPHIPVEDHHVHLRIHFLHLQGIFYRPLAADPAAVGILLIPGAHALDKDGLIPLGHLGLVVMDFVSQFQLRHYPGVLAVEEFFGPILMAAGGHHHDTVVDVLFFLTNFHFGVEVAFVAAETHNFGTGEQFDFIVGLQPS